MTESNARTQIEPSVDGSENVIIPAEKEVVHAAPNKTTEEADPVESQPSGGETGEPGEESGEAGDAGEENQEPTSDEGEVSQLRSTVAALKQTVEKLQRGEIDDPEPTEDDPEKSVLIPEFDAVTLGALEEKHGIAASQAQMMRSMVNQVAKNILKQVQGSTSGYRRDQAIAAMESEKDEKGQPRFPGLRQYKAEMDEFLKDYNPSLHSRKELLERAYWYGKGRNADKAVAAVRKGKEVNRVIAGKTRLSGSVASTPGEKPVVLTSSQKAAARWHPGGERGYIADLKRRGSNATRLEKAV